MKKKSLILLLLMITVIALSSFGGAREVRITDDLNREVVLEQKPERIISLAPSNTEILFALGLKEQIIGVTEFCDYPAEALETTNVGSITEPNLERIVELSPDLVIAASINPRESVERLEELGISVVGFDPKNVTEVLTTISELGRITGQEDKAEQLLKDMQARKDKVVKTVEENVEQRPTVFYEIWREPLTTAGANTFISDLISLAGGINVADDTGEEWPQYSLEVLISKDPDVYLSSEHSWQTKVTPESIKERPNYSNLTAVKNDRITVLDQDIVSRGGPRIISGLEDIAAAIHSELFDY